MYWAVEQKHEIFLGISDAISPRYIRKNPHSKYARVPHVMAQFVLIIETLSLCYKDSPNTRNGANLRSPFPIMAPLRYHLVWKIAYSLTVCNKEIMRAIQSTSVAAEAE